MTFIDDPRGSGTPSTPAGTGFVPTPGGKMDRYLNSDLNPDRQEPKPPPVPETFTPTPGGKMERWRDNNPYPDQIMGGASEPPPPEVSRPGTFLHEAERGVVPGLTGRLGMVAGAELGGAIGLWGGPLVGLAGAIIGGGIGAIGGSYVGGMAQEGVLTEAPEEWKKAIGQDAERRQAEGQAYPYTQFAGGLAGGTVGGGFRPGFGAVKPPPETASAVSKVLAKPLVGRFMGATFGGGFEAGQEYATEGTIDPAKVAMAGAAGAIANKSTRLGDRIDAFGARNVRRAFGLPTGEAAPALAIQPAPEAQPGAPAEAPAHAVPPSEQAPAPVPGPPDVHAVARQIAPDTFREYDDLTARRATFRNWLENVPDEQAADPQAVRVARDIKETESRLRELAPDVEEAYRKAGEQMPAAEPAAPPAPPSQEEEAAALPSETAVPPAPSFIAQDVTQKLLAAGRPQGEAEGAGLIHQAYWETRAARFNGTRGTAEEMYRREAPEIRGVAAAPTAPAAPPAAAPAIPADTSLPPPLRAAPLPSELPNTIQTFAPGDLLVDARRFQFKDGGDEAGVTDRLKGVTKWDDIKSGMVLVWQDAAGKNYIVDGHQRLALATRIAKDDPAQKPEIIGRVLRETEGITDKGARSIAALRNIGEGTGTAIDAAKVLRDDPDLADKSLPVNDLVRQARGLVNLSDDAFLMIVNDVVPPSQGAIVGRLVPGDPQMQTALIDLLAKTEPANATQAEAIVRQGIEAGAAKRARGAQGSLFGEDDIVESLYLDRAKVLEKAMAEIRRDKRVFSVLTKEQETIEASGNKLAADLNEKRAAADAQALQILQTLASRRGPISEALGRAAERARADGRPATAVRGFIAEIRGMVESGDLARLADGLERGPTHVGTEDTAGIIERAPERGSPAAERRGDAEAGSVIEEAKAGPQGEEPPSPEEDAAQRVMFQRNLMRERPRVEQQAVSETPLFGPTGESELFQREQRAQTQTPEFRNWFGDSKVVDEVGDPLVVYHGTSADFEQFKLGEGGPGQYADTKDAIFFTSEPRLASSFAAIRGRGKGDANVYPVFLSIEKPIVHDFKGELKDPALIAGLVRRAKEAGNDGVHIKNVVDPVGHDFDRPPGDLWVALHPTQIKSAIGNRGTFDPNDPRILFQRGEGLAPPGDRIKISDDGSVVHAQPENMQIPDWGKGLSWGMKAFRTERGGQKILQIRDARVPPEMQGQGLGQQMYESMADLAAREGRALHSDGTVTLPAANRWMELNRGGRAVIKNPDAQYRPGPPEAPELGRFETSDGSPVFRIDPPGPEAPLFQQGDIKRGKIRLREAGPNTITLLRDANASTFLHETGHDWLDRMLRDAEDADAPDDLKADAQNTLRWLGAGSVDDVATRHHEQFARGFENYMMEGRAPSRGLAAVFAKFRDWLLKIYKSADALKAPLNDEIRGVFDRLLAVDPEKVTIAPDIETGGPMAEGAMARANAELARIIGEHQAGGAPGVPAEGEGGPEAQAQEPQPAPGYTPVVKNPLPTAPTARFDSEKAGNIRLENLPMGDIKDPQAVLDVIRKSAAGNNNFQTERRGVISDAEAFAVAEAMGKDPAFLDRKKIGEAWTKEEILAIVPLLMKSASTVKEASAKASASGAPADLLAVEQERARLQMIHDTIQGKVSGAMAEAGRALQGFNALKKLAAKMAAGDEGRIIQEVTGRTLFQSQREATFASKLFTPQQVAKFISDSALDDFHDRLIFYYVNALISGPITHLRYSVGNAINALERPLIEIPLAAAYGRAREALGYERAADRVFLGEAGAQLYAIFKGSRDGLSAATEAFQSGVSPPLPGERLMHDVQYALPPRGPIGTALSVPGRSVAGIHSFFKSLRYEQEIQGLAHRTAMREGLDGDAKVNRIAELTTNPTPAMMDAATKSALRELYMAPTDYDSAMGSLVRFTNRSLLAKIVMPFMKIGSQITRQAFLERTPLALASREARANLMFQGGTQPELLGGGVGPGAAFDMQAAKITAGIALMGTTVLMAAEGMITGDGPSEPDRRRVWLLNHRPNTMQIGNITIPFQGLGHLGMLMRFSANMYDVGDAIDTDEDWSNVAIGFFNGLSDSVLDENFMRGVKDALDALYHPKEYGEAYLRQFVTNWLPFSVGLGQMARETDPFQREVHDIFEAAQAKIPWYREQLKPKRDMFGEPIGTGGLLTGGREAAPTEAERYANDPVVKAMDALQIGIPALPKKIMGVKLSEEEYDDFARIAGQFTKIVLNDLVATPGWNDTPPGQRIEMIHKIVTKQREVAIETVKVLHAQDILTKAMAARAAKFAPAAAH